MSHSKRGAMASLTAHLRRPHDHERLAFHPECPLCTEARLAGALPSTALVGRRTQALLASGVLAVATATPGAALAADPEQQVEGTPAPEQVVTGDVPADSDFDPGGESTDLPIDAGPAPETLDAVESGELELEQEPVTQDGAPEEAASPDQQPAPPTTDAGAVPPEAVSPTPTPAPPSSTPTPEPPATPPVQLDTDPPAAPPQDASPAPRAEKRDSEQKRTPHAPENPPQSVRTITAPPTEPAPVTAPTTVQVTQAQDAPPATTRTRSAARRGDHHHVVQRDESLWSIASDVLGENASPARVAREVNRLWELNSARIGTGDRDLLMTGTRLELR